MEVCMISENVIGNTASDIQVDDNLFGVNGSINGKGLIGINCSDTNVRRL